MHFSLARWLLTACIGAIVSAANSELEVDLVFPRNETYAPTDSFPVVFAVQNTERAQLLNLVITYTMRNLSNYDENIYLHQDLRAANWSTHDPHFAYDYFSPYTSFNRFTTEGRWNLTWDVRWQSCNEKNRSMVGHSSVWSTLFTIKNSTQEVDLVAATAN